MAELDLLVVGSGVAGLSAAVRATTQLELSDSRSFKNGLVWLNYQRA